MKYLNNNRGVAAVEFAICLLLFLLPLVCGLIDVGLMVYDRQVITNASREGVRAGITGIEIDAIKQIVVNYCNGKLINLNGSSELNSDLIITNPDDDPVDGFPDPDEENNLTVMVIYNYNSLLGHIWGWGPTNPNTLSVQTTMRME